MITACGFFASIDARKRSFLLARVPTQQRRRCYRPAKIILGSPDGNTARIIKRCCGMNVRLFGEEPRDGAITPSK
jgi:hypothetical protein